MFAYLRDQYAVLRGAGYRVPFEHSSNYEITERRRRNVPRPGHVSYSSARCSALSLDTGTVHRVGYRVVTEDHT